MTFDGTTTLTTGGTADSQDFHHVVISGTVTAGADDIDIDGNLAISGTLTAAAGTITVAGNWANTGTFTHNSGTVVFDTAGTSLISGNTTFFDLTSEIPDKTITFTAGATQTVAGTLTLTGTGGHEVVLRSSVDTSKWMIAFPNGSQSVNYVDVKDSDALTSTVICVNCADSGNNNANWVFGDPNYTITYPQDGKTIDTKPTILGSVTAGAAVQIKDIGNNVIATVTADAAGYFLVEITTPLAAGAQTLTPWVGGVPGLPVDVTVAAAPTPAQVPVVTVPASARVSTPTPTITGEGNPGQTVTLYAQDANGNLHLQAVGSGTVDANGDYAVAVTTALPKGTVSVSAVVDGVAGNVVELKFTDPYGVVFDSVTDEPIEGAVVTIYRASDNQPAVAGVDLDPGDVNPVTTGADGFYSFLTADGDYYITVDAGSGYAYPSEAAEFPAGRTIVTGSKGEEFSVAGVIIEMDHPMDANTALLLITKEANKREISVGGIVTYTVTVENVSGREVVEVFLRDTIPAGFKYMEGRTLLDGVKAAEPAGNRPLRFELGNFTAGQV